MQNASDAAHAAHDPNVFRRQFWIVLLLTLPVIAWSGEVEAWLGYQFRENPVEAHPTIESLARFLAEQAARPGGT